MAEAPSEGEVSSTSKDFLTIRDCKVAYTHTLKRILLWSLRPEIYNLFESLALKCIYMYVCYFLCRIAVCVEHCKCTCTAYSVENKITVLNFYFARLL